MTLAEKISANHQESVHAIRALYDEVAQLGDTDAAYEIENKRARAWAKQRSQILRGNT
jgi:hypothetical protein